MMPLRWSLILAALRQARGAVLARDLDSALPGKRPGAAAPILAGLAHRRLAVVLPGVPHRYEAASGRGEQGRLPGVDSRDDVA